MSRISARKSMTDNKMDLYKYMAKQCQPFVKLTRLDITNINTAGGSQSSSSSNTRNRRSKTAGDVFKPLETLDHKKLRFSMSSVYNWSRKRGNIGNVSIGRNLFHTNAIDSVQVSDEKGNKLTFRCDSGKVYRKGRNLKKQQTEITVKNFQRNGTIIETYCSCDHGARNEACKHIAALGFTLEHYSQTGQTQANISTRGLSKRTSIQQSKKRSAAAETDPNKSDSEPIIIKSKKKSSGVLPISLQQLVTYSINSKAISPAFLSLIPITDASRGLHDYTKV